MLSHVKHVNVYIHVYLTAVFFLPAILGALFHVHALPPPVDQGTTTKPLAGKCITCLLFGVYVLHSV